MKRSPYLPLIWASDISVHGDSGERIFVMGKLPRTYADFQPTRDLFHRYLYSLRSEFAQKGSEQASPHIRFANAKSDEQLLEFVKNFGPVAATEVAEDQADETQPIQVKENDELDWSTQIGAFQDLAMLRAERRTYAAALELVTELGRGERAANVLTIQRLISDIAEGIGSWPEQQETERLWRISHNFAPMAWRFDSNHRDFISLLKTDVFLTEPSAGLVVGAKVPSAIEWRLRTKPYRAGHLVLCALINAFETEVQYFEDRPVETLPFSSLRFGVRPVLYLILKLQYLRGSGAPICKNDLCRDFFEIKRAGQVFCKPECSQSYRQRKYWAKSGAIRRKELAAKKRKKIREKQRAK
jgi:hypothetical protein